MKICHQGLRNESVLFHVALGAAGYETRSRFFFSTATALGYTWEKLFVIDMGGEAVHDLEANVAFFQSMNAIFLPSDSIGLEKELSTWLSAADATEKEVRVLVDVSSMTRQQMAVTLELFERSKNLLGVDVIAEFVYSPAVFSEPPNEFGSVRFKGPVSPFFGGWRTDLEKSAALILGLGYEPDVALGIIEDLEPESVVTFCPVNEDKRYEERILEANQWVFEGPMRERIIYYRMADPLFLFESLMSSLVGVVKDYRPVVIPFGPKIFALVAMLAAVALRPTVSVWRVSSGQLESPKNRLPSGSVVNVLVDFGAD